MLITLYKNISDTRTLDKTLGSPVTMEGTLRGDTDVVAPSILVSGHNLSEWNYAYIPEFHRYYYIDEMTVVRNGLWRVSFKVDVLMSFKDAIKGCTGILSNSEKTGISDYLTGEQYKRLVKTTTDIIDFPNGLSEDGEYILIVAGGAGVIP